MNSEKRKDERIVIPGEVEINHRNKTIQCRIENISNYGAYLKVENSSDSNGINIGDSVSFRISTPEIAVQELSGKILRSTIEDCILYIAVYFFSPYNFD